MQLAHELHEKLAQENYMSNFRRYITCTISAGKLHAQLAQVNDMYIVQL
jgi:hypothetical protein